MSDLFEKNPNEQENTAPTAENAPSEESTVFSAPVEHKDKASKKTGKKRLTSIIAACLAVAVLVGGTIAVINLIPEMKGDEAPDSIFEDISVIDADSTTFSSVKVKNTNGEFNFTIQKIESSGSSGTTDYWTIEGVDYSKLSSSALNSIISSAASLTATREVEKDAAECGFDKPSIKVTVTSASNETYTFVVGNESPDGLGYYLMVEGSEKIYVAPSTEFESFEFALLDLTDTTSIPATTFLVDTSDNKVDDGTYAYFDSLAVSGNFYPQAFMVSNSPESADISTVTPYMMYEPVQRFANTETLTPLIYLFSKTTTVSGNYALDVNDETLKLFGLDKPDIVVSMTIKGETKTFKISKIDGTYSAVVYDGAKMIRKVANTDLSFLDYRIDSYYNKSLCFYQRTNVKELTFSDSEGDVTFDITAEGEDELNMKYYVKVGDKDITEENYMNFYRELLTIQCNDFSVEELSAEPESSMSFTFFSGTKAVIKFYRVSDTEYQYNIDGINMGKIPSATYNKLIKLLKTVAAGESTS